MPPAPGKPVNAQHLQVALHHANLLEDRKRVEAAVLDAVMALMDAPSSPDADPRCPSAGDALRFRDAVLLFQPADYDALVEERNIAGRCGYALCPRPKQKAPSDARKHFVDTAVGVEIVDRKALEVWCSDDCARRALYVKVQLSEEPAWMRQAGNSYQIKLLVDNAADHHSVLPLRPKLDPPVAGAPRDGEDDEVTAAWAERDGAMAVLAVERGETGHGRAPKQDLVKDQVVERDNGSVPPRPPQASELATMAIEGHVPSFEKKEGNEDDDEDDDARDWDKHLPR